MNFYPRSPCGERQLQGFLLAQGHNFYPRSPCGERPSCSLRYWSRAMISIHALLAESDGVPLFYNNRCQNFYPRSPCGERRTTLSKPSMLLGISIHALLAESDDVRLIALMQISVFLSTLSLRRATGEAAVLAGNGE